MKIINFSKIIAVICIIGGMNSCQNNPKKEIDTPIKGEIRILADESYRPIIEQEEAVFESHYPDAKIQVEYRPAIDVLNGFTNDSFRVLISSLAPDSASFENFFARNKFRAKKTVIGKDGIALIVHKSRKKVMMSRGEIEKILLGDITDFSQLKNPSGSGKISLVFDNPKSSTVLYMQDSILRGKELKANAYAQKNNEEVIEYVSKNPNALGIIGVSWISDEADENAQKFREDISMVEVGEDGFNYFYAPFQGYIATHKYPLRRNMVVTVKEGGARLGSGFTNFLTGEYGQKIILKAGLVPAAVLTRVVLTE